MCGRRRLLFSRKTQKEKPVVVRERAVKEIKIHEGTPLVESDQVPFRCQGCGEDFSCEYDLIQQLEKHQKRRFFCQICHEISKFKQHLTYHAYIHTISSETGGEQSHMHLCELCGKTFMRKGNLGRHRKEFHPLQRYLCCNICGKKFITIRDLSLHSRKHSEGNRSLCCQHCGKSFGYRSNLEYHLRMHSNERPFSCETCGKTFKFKYCLSQHLDVHTGNPFSCIVCGKQFGSRSSRHNHLKLHSACEISEARLKYKESQIFPCDACGEVFNKRSMLEKHLNKHLQNGKKLFPNGKKLFPCQTCGETFDNTSKLNIHRVIHSKRTNIDDRPFSCDTCEETFKWWSDLDEHVKMHTIQLPSVHRTSRNDF